MRQTLARLSVWLVVGAVALGLAVSGVGWAGGEWMESNLKGYQAELAEAQNRIAAAKALMAELEKKTGGLEYLEMEGQRFLIWRKGDAPYQMKDGRWEGRWVVQLKGK